MKKKIWTRLMAGAVVGACMAGMLAGCGRGEDDSEEVVVDVSSAPEDVSWRSFHGVLVPSASDSGPRFSDPVPHGFDRSPQGAVLAAMNAQVFMAVAGDDQWVDVAQNLLAISPGRDQWAQGRALISVSGSVEDAPEFRGFRVVEYSEDEAAVVLAAEYPGFGLGAYPVQLVWQSADWKVVLPTLEDATDVVALDDLDDFTEFSGGV